MMVKIVKYRKTLYTLGSFIVLGALITIGLFTYEPFGKIPSGKFLTRIEASPHYHETKEVFVNRRPDIKDTMTVGADFWADPLGREVPNFLFNNNQTEPAGLLPEERNPDLAAFEASDGRVKFIWLGHSTVLLSIDGRVILFDPVFSDHASPFPIAAKRFQPPVIHLEDLPEVDHIIISHDHYDHLDMETVKYFVKSDVKFITPLGVGSHLRYWGVDEARITELDWWEEANLDGMIYAATPSQHFSGRIGVMHNDKTLWASWVIAGKTDSVYFSGDSGYDTHYKDIGRKYGPFDVVFMENGQYNESWRAVHNLPDEAITAFKDVGGTYLVPVHWGMFNLSVHNWFDPPKEITRLAKAEDIKLITPRLGQLIDLNNPPLYDQWWLEVVGAEVQ